MKYMSGIDSLIKSSIIAAISSYKYNPEGITRASENTLIENYTQDTDKLNTKFRATF